MPIYESKRLSHFLTFIYLRMSLSRHFPPSTQAILDAQQSPPGYPSPSPPRLSPKKDRSIIVISSSPDERSTPYSTKGPVEITSGDESDPFEPWAPLPRQEDSVAIIDKDEFARLVGGYKYKAQPLRESANILRDQRPQNTMTRKTSLATFFRECKPNSKRGENKVKTTLTTRVTLPTPKGSTIVPNTVSTPTTKATKRQASFFTTWAAAQAPATRGARATSRKKVTRKKKSDVQVIVLSPKSGQESVRKRGEEKVDTDRRLGEKRDVTGKSMWDASNRGLEGELYDDEGSMIFSQELRSRAESSPEVPLQQLVSSVEDVQVVTVERITESIPEVPFPDVASLPQDIKVVAVESVTASAPEIIEDGLPARRRGVAFENSQNGMPIYSTFTLQQLQVTNFPRTYTAKYHLE